MGGCRRRNIKTIGSAERLYRDRLKTIEEDTESEERKIDTKAKKKTPKNVTIVSKHEYALHKAARDGMMTDIGKLSELFHKKRIDEKSLEIEMRRAVKRSVRKTNLRVALRAWDEVYDRLDRPSKRVVNNVPIQLEACAEAWSALFGWVDKRLIPVQAPEGPQPKPQPAEGDIPAVSVPISSDSTEVV